jgi:hypothetical protein
MIITNKTTVKDVEGCPFIGVVNMPMFMHIELDDIPIYDPFTFEKGSEKTMTSKPIDVKVFRGNYKDLVENTKCKGGMVYFLPNHDGKIVHKDSGGEFVRMAQVKLTNYHFNQKVYESARKVYEPDVVEIPQKNYKYILIRK